MSSNVAINDIINDHNFILGIWSVTPSLNTFTRITENADVEPEVRKVTPKVMTLCEFLIRFHGQPKSQEEIAQAVWPERAISDSSIYQAVAQLRKALQHDSDNTDYVERVSGKGYRIHAPLSQTTSTLNPSYNVNINNARTSSKKRFQFIGVAVFLGILASSIAFFIGPKHSTQSPLKTIAILPTTNLSLPHNQAYDSFNQLILSELIVDTQHKFIYWRANDADNDTQAKIQSTIQRNQDNLVATVQILESTTNSVLWAESFSAKSTDYLKLKNDVVTGLLHYLAPNLVATTHDSPQDPFFEEYALARYFWDQREPQALGKAQEIYQNILQQSPQHTDALIGLCHTYLYLSIYSDLSQESAHQRCTPIVEQAAIQAPNKGELLATQALLLVYNEEHDNQMLDALFKKAINAAPNYAMAHHWYGNFLRLTGKYNSALEQHSIAYSLDPLSPIIIRGLAYSHLNLRQLANARKYYARALAIEPSYAHRAVEELDFFLLNTHRAQAFISWLDKPSNLANMPTYRLTQALVWLGLGDIKAAENLINKAQLEPVNQAFLLYCQGALASAKDDVELALKKMTARLNLTPNVTRYAMPYITSLFFNNKFEQALTAHQNYFPEIKVSGLITNENSGQFILLATIYKHLNNQDMFNKLNSKIDLFLTQQDGQLTVINKIYWLSIANQNSEVITLINQQFDNGWLPDYNDDIYVFQKLKQIYITSGGTEKEWQRRLTHNRRI